MASTVNSTVHTMAGENAQPPVTTTYMNDHPLVWRPWQEESAWQPPISARFGYDNIQNQPPRFDNDGVNTGDSNLSYFTGINMNHQVNGTIQPGSINGAIQPGSFTENLLGGQMPTTGFSQESTRPTRIFRGYQQNRRVAVPYPAYQGGSVPAYQPRKVYNCVRATRALRPILPRHSLSDPRLRAVGYNVPRGYPYNRFTFAPGMDNQVSSAPSYPGSIVQVRADYGNQSNSRSPGPDELIQSCDGLSGGVMIGSNSRLYQWYENEFRENPCNSEYFRNVFMNAKLDMSSYLDYDPPQNLSEAVKAYIDYLLFENRQRVMPLEQTQPSAPSNISWSDMSREDYFNDMMSEPTDVPTKKLIGWLRLFGMTASKNDLTNEIEIIPITTTSTPKKSTPPITAHPPWAEIPLQLDMNNNEIVHNEDILQSSVRAAGIDINNSSIQRSGTPLEMLRDRNILYQAAPQHIPNVTQTQPTIQQGPALPKITIVKQDESAETTAAFVETLARLAKHQQERFLAGEPHTPSLPPTFTTGYPQPSVPASAFTSIYRSASVCNRFPSVTPAISSHSLPSLSSREGLERRDYELHNLARVSSQYGQRLCTNTPEPDSTSSGDQLLLKLPPIATLRKTISSASNDADDESSSSDNSVHELSHSEKDGVHVNALSSVGENVWSISAKAKAAPGELARAEHIVSGEDYRIEVRDDLDVDSDSGGEVASGEIVSHGVILVNGIENREPTHFAAGDAVSRGGSVTGAHTYRASFSPHQPCTQPQHLPDGQVAETMCEETEICRAKRRLSAEFSPNKKRRL